MAGPLAHGALRDHAREYALDLPRLVSYSPLAGSGFACSKPQLPIQALVNAAPAPLGWRVASRGGLHTVLRRPGTAAGTTAVTARARYGAGAVAHRSEKRLPASARPAHVFSCPVSNSLGGEGLPQSSATPEQDSENAYGARLSLPKHGTSSCAARRSQVGQNARDA